MSTETLPSERRERAIAVVSDDGPFSYLFDTAKFEHLWRISNAFAKSELVPKIFQGKPENCFVALQAAFRMGVDPFAFLQACYVVAGKPSIEAKLAIALLNTSGKIRGSIGFTIDGEGMKRSCTATAVDAGTGEIRDMTVSMQDAANEGWIDKAGSKWKTIPDLMLKYRAASWLIRVHYPEVIYGLQTREENEDTEEQCGDVVEQPRVAKRVQPVELKPNGTTSHTTTEDFRKLDLPPDVLDMYSRAVAIGDETRVDEVKEDAMKLATDDKLCATIEHGADCAKAEIRRKPQKKQGELV